jgi:phage baseplate assembly protein W
MAEKFLGTGWAFPLQVNDRGEVEMSGHEQDIQEAIRIILGTAKGERVMHPDFGCGIHNYVFEVINSSTLTLIETGVREALTLWEPRIDLTKVDVKMPDRDDLEDENEDKKKGAKEGELWIDIEYKVRTTNNRFNLVYPFYLKEGA